MCQECAKELHDLPFNMSFAEGYLEHVYEGSGDDVVLMDLVGGATALTLGEYRQGQAAEPEPEHEQ